MFFFVIFFRARSAKVRVRKDGVLLFYIAESDGKVHETHPKLKKHMQIIFFQARSAKVHVRKDGVLLFYIAEGDGKVHVRKDGVLILLKNVFFIYKQKIFNQN